MPRAAGQRAILRSLTAVVEPTWAGKGKGRGRTELAIASGTEPIRERAGDLKIVIVSDNEAIGQMTQTHAKTWTVHSASLLNGGWLNVRDNALKNATAS